MRLNLLATDVIDWSYVASYGYDRFLADTDTLVKEYTGAGIASGDLG